LLKSVVSIDIGSSLIKLVQLSGSSGKIRLEKVGVMDNPTSNFRTDGYGVGKDALARAIRYSLRKSRIKARDAVSSLGGSSIIIQYFKFPPFSEKELESAVGLEAQRVMGGNWGDPPIHPLLRRESSGTQGGQNFLNRRKYRGFRG